MPIMHRLKAGGPHFTLEQIPGNHIKDCTNKVFFGVRIGQPNNMFTLPIGAQPAINAEMKKICFKQL
jgi:hypothetical protein